MASTAQPVQRNALAFFSIGILILVASLVILAIWTSSTAHDSEDFYGPAIELYPLTWVGCFFIFWSLAGYGVNGWLADGLWIAGLVGLILLEFFIVSQNFASLGGIFLLSLAVMLGVAVLLLLHAHWREALKALLLGLGSAALVLVAYGFGRQDIPLTLWGPTDPREPPVPDWGLLGLIVLLGVGLFFLARLWSRPARVDEPVSSSPPPSSGQDISPGNG